MSKKRRHYYDAYETVKGQQHVANKQSNAINDWEIRDLFLDAMDHLLNRRQRGRIGHIERKKKR